MTNYIVSFVNIEYYISDDTHEQMAKIVPIGETIEAYRVMWRYDLTVYNFNNERKSGPGLISKYCLKNRMAMYIVTFVSMQSCTFKKPWEQIAEHRTHCEDCRSTSAFFLCCSVVSPRTGNMKQRFDCIKFQQLLTEDLISSIAYRRRGKYTWWPSSMRGAEHPLSIRNETSLSWQYYIGTPF